MEKKIKTLSLFSGAGGLDIGFHNAGFDIIGCVEIEQQYCDTLAANKSNYLNSSAKIICQDIRQFDATQFLGMGIECVIGGPPCQPFSAAGRRAGGVPGIQDERGKLFECYCNVLQVLKPKVFIFENVYGLKGANGGEPWNEIVASFLKLGYSISNEIIDAADYGVPQHRERLIVVGSLGMGFIFPEPTHGPDSSSGKELVSIWDAIHDIQPDVDEPEPLGGMYGHLLPLVPEGLNYAFFTKEMGYPEPYFAWRSKFHDFLYKADRSKPSRTLKAQPGKFTGPFHWNNRHFTINELKRIQSFPDDYIITGTSTQVMTQIGNSVPPKLAEVLAVSVREQILRPVKKQTYPLRPCGFSSTFRRRQREISEYYKEVAKQEIAKRFHKNDDSENARLEFSKKYYCGYLGRFSKAFQENKFTTAQFEKYETAYQVVSSCHQEHISIQMYSLHEDSVALSGHVDIIGLKKYLLKIDTLRIEFSIMDISEIFNVWDIVQKELVDISQFYSLIDIYGHYANRGDTVSVQTEIISPANDPMINAICFFGNSDNCGIYLTREDLARRIGIEQNLIDKLVFDMRDNRYDVRISLTHPTIRTEEVICTYPFPMLSERVLFDKKPRVLHGGI